MLLYSFRRCPFAIRVRMVLHEKSIPFDVKEEDLKNMSPELKSLHPQAKVPLLVDDKLVLFESSVITEYLDDLYSEPPLMPPSAKGKAMVRRWTVWCNQLFKPAVDCFKYRSRQTDPEPESVIVNNLHCLLDELESHLKQNGGWIIDQHFSLGDIHVFPFFRQLYRVNPPLADIERYAKTIAWLKKITDRESFKKAMLKY